MKHYDIVTFGGTASIFLGLAHLIAAVTAALMPPELQADPTVTPHEFWTVLSHNPTAHLSFHWASAAMGLIGLAVVPALSRLVRSSNEGLVAWVNALAYLAFAVQARSHLMEVAFDRKIIPIYLSSDEATQRAVHVIAGLALDVPDGFLTYGGLGLWVIVVSVLAAKNAGLPKALSFVGIGTGIAYLVGVIGYVLFVRPLIVVSIGLGGVVLAPIWFVWVGARLRRADV